MREVASLEVLLAWEIPLILLPNVLPQVRSALVQVQLRKGHLLVEKRKLPAVVGEKVQQQEARVHLHE